MACLRRSKPRAVYCLARAVEERGASVINEMAIYLGMGAPLPSHPGTARAAALHSSKNGHTRSRRQLPSGLGGHNLRWTLLWLEGAERPRRWLR
jgi:hypothetical protein